MSYTYLLYHIVVRTKRSEPTILSAHERELHMYIYQFIKAHDSALYRVNGMPDHIHILVSLHPSIAISDFMRDLKTATSKMMKSAKDKYPMFDGWESEYYASTVSKNDQEKIRQYIINQKDHHKWVNSREELIQLCIENGIPYNEKYI